MVFGEVKDIVRQNLGVDDLPNDVLDFILDSGRRDIEKRGNWYYMVSSADFNLTSTDQTYTLTASPISATNFKDIRILLEKESTATMWNEVYMQNEQYVDQVYGTEDDGEPLDAVLVNTVLTIYPIPDAAYNMRMYFWQWTSNPDNNLTSDELTNRWPELLIYSATAFGSRYLGKDDQKWQALFEKEILMFINYDNERKYAERLSMEPRTGPKFAPKLRD